MNGSPLFTGDAGSGEREIRRYILETDVLSHHRTGQALDEAELEAEYAATHLHRG